MDTPTATIATRSFMEADRYLPSGFTIDGRYEIGEALGQGGYGVVYRARDLELKRDIAIKVMHAARIRGSALVRFRREVQVARDVVSPYLRRIFDIGESDGLIYLTMEFVDGLSLRARLKAEGPLGLVDTLDILRQVLRGLEVLHGRDIIHRDVKPGNILLARDGTVKLSDFGLARFLESDETRATNTLSLVGTLDYLSPEQALGYEVGPRSDLYSLGVTLFECLTGHMPHRARSSLGTLLQHIQSRADDVRKHRPEVPTWLAGLTARLLEKKPEDRFASTTEVLVAIDDEKIPWRWRLPAWRGWTYSKVLATSGLLIALIALGWRFRPVPTLGPPSNGAIRAISWTGRVLWERPVFETAALTARLSPWTRPRVVTFFGNRSDPEQNRRGTLQILNLDTGEPIHKRRLQGESHNFGRLGFANAFRPNISVDDINDDGYEEVIVDFHHTPQWPSYSVLYEPRLDRDRVIFAASGLHSYLGSVDLDGDGQKELLFGGTNNRMGWLRSLAAVNLDPPLDEKLAAPGHHSTAKTPGDVYGLTGGGNANALAWYTLLPSWSCTQLKCIEIDFERRGIRVQNSDDAPILIDFNGFRQGGPEPPKLPAKERLRRLRIAYSGLFEARRFQEQEAPKVALEHIDKALQAAMDADDEFLELWTRRVKADILVGLGEMKMAEDTFLALHAQYPREASNISFEAGNAFHLAGYLEHAIEWYEKGWERGGGDHGGRPTMEHMIGIVMAWGEMGRVDKADDAISRYRAQQKQPNYAAGCQLFVDWRLGRANSLAERVTYDPFVYWWLELRYQRGESPESLLSDVEYSLKRVSEESRALVRSLRGQLIADLREPESGLSDAREALEQLRHDMRKFTIARAHYEWITNRFATIARDADQEEEAATAEEAFLDWNVAQLSLRSPIPYSQGIRRP